MPSGTAVLDFGAFPGSAHATVAVTGQAAIQAASLVEAWFAPTATADHNADEHKVAPLIADLTYSDLLAGTGFTIQGWSRRNRLAGRFSLNWAWV